MYIQYHFFQNLRTSRPSAIQALSFTFTRYLVIDFVCIGYLAKEAAYHLYLHTPPKHAITHTDRTSLTVCLRKSVQQLGKKA